MFNLSNVYGNHGLFNAFVYLIFCRCNVLLLFRIHTHAYTFAHVYLSKRATRSQEKQNAIIVSEQESEQTSSNGHFGHGCYHSHVKHNAPGYHYRCVMPPLHRKRGMTFVEEGGKGMEEIERVQKERKRRKDCAFPGTPGAPLLVPLPSSATDVIRYHAFVRVRFRAVHDIKLRKERKRIAREIKKRGSEERKEMRRKTKQNNCKNR